MLLIGYTKVTLDVVIATLQIDPSHATGTGATVELIPMTILEHVQKKEQKRRALFEAQFTNAKAYRGVQYDKLANGPAVHGNLTYRGAGYIK